MRTLPVCLGAEPCACTALCHAPATHLAEHRSLIQLCSCASCVSIQSRGFMLQVMFVSLDHVNEVMEFAFVRAGDSVR